MNQSVKMQQAKGSLPSKNDLLRQFLNSSNPREFLNSLISKNPNMQNAMQLMQSSGMTPKDFFYNYAQKQGLDPDQFINSLKN